MEKDILEDIIAHKRIEIAQQKQMVSAAQLENKLYEQEEAGEWNHVRSMKQHLAQSGTGIIAEFKRRSPSKGWINRQADPQAVTSAYEKAGASALSILTDEMFFGGTLKDIRLTRTSVALPILRKDFVIDRYQLLQAKTVAADAVLLIAAALTPKECLELAQEAHRLKLEVLLEIHSEPELGHVNEHVDMVGVNNRNLGTFHTDVENSFRLADKLPDDFLLVSESGISNPETVNQLRQAGFRGFLIGETFMKTEHPGNALSDFIKNIRP